MAYRKLTPPQPEYSPHTIYDATTPGDLVVHNGTHATFKLPCYYQEVDQPVPAMPYPLTWHNMEAWPNPRDIDRTAQPGTDYRVEIELNQESIVPIHLTEEGYDGVVVDIVSPPVSGLTMTGSIGDPDDWVISLEVNVNLSAAVSADQEYTFAVRAYIEDEKVDTVFIGTLHVLKAPMFTEPE